ncbi:hypothetical protein CLAFUW4_11911 [Fulvia fulva]|uniref:Uncharacterized protein n=1 Tax=Passalora fulva TaxID=5499 RepID=A0A9Q8USE8_PASFU|nr:uncharacterized protein CLAFUR5_10955 [Fulvia fulva]KAK4618125.1 hypothetical protein CLAFUR4_11916 [Fulvia fulva]KAK4618908.1 hypothetical protein CLAFUR0_11928 [Fulvia fulva]UJO20711.1 hypothetical protein CLAFUR5_10955 [Fulvia fulva]WPV18022.1 hypothetical protein CLAFUW4_11911 [Fulvia fulva]WPV32776.1 hypothetical protein CLAFUW7_11918 [Fulvia fulva]
MSSTQSSDSPATSTDPDTESLVASTPANSEASNSSNSTSEPTAVEIAIAAHLERVVYDIRDAMNTRNFQRDAHPWNLFMAAYKCEAVAYMSKPQVGMTEFLRDHERLSRDHPQIHYHFQDVSTHVDPDAIRADCLINEETTGWPPGVTRRSVGVCKFKLVSGVWRCIGYYNSRGIDAD